MLTVDQVKHISKLANIKLNDSEIEKFRTQLSPVLDYFDILKNADTSSISPKTHAFDDIKNRFQELELGSQTLNRKDAVKNAPQKTDEYFVTDAVL